MRYPQSSSIFVWDFPWNKPSSYWGTPTAKGPNLPRSHQGLEGPGGGSTLEARFSMAQGDVPKDLQDRRPQKKGDLWTYKYHFIPFLGGWISVHQLFWCDLPGVVMKIHLLNGSRLACRYTIATEYKNVYLRLESLDATCKPRYGYTAHISYVHICIHVCMYACMYVCMYVYIYMLRWWAWMALHCQANGPLQVPALSRQGSLKVG